MLETDTKFLTFYLGNKDIAVIPLESIAEVFQISHTDICGVPQMPACIQGIYNWRGEMLWLIDLEGMLGFSDKSERNLASKMMTIVIQNEGKYLGLLVRQLMDIESLNFDQMKSPNSQLFSHEMLPFLKGYFLNESEQVVLAMNPEYIINSPDWQIHN